VDPITMGQSLIRNGVGGGPFGVVNPYTGAFDPGMLRSFIESDPNSPDRGRPCAQVRTGMVYNTDKSLWEPKFEKRRVEEWEARGVRSPVFNATTLTRDDWIQIDRAVVRTPLQRLSAYADLRAANVIGGFDAWSKLTYEYSAMGTAGEVVKDMDATAPARNDTPLNLIRSTPLPVIHGDFEYPQRLLDVSRGAGGALDTTMFSEVTRRFWEMVEKTCIGTETGVSYGTRSTGPFPHTGTSTEYGYTNWPYRITKTDLNSPTGTNPQDVVQDVMEMIETMNGAGYFGPFVLYHSTPYSIYLNSDYFRSGGTSAVRSVRERLMELDGLSAIRRLDYLTSGYQLILVDFGTQMLAAIDGMQPRTVQWSERGGYIQKFMVLGVQTLVLKAPSSGVGPIVHGTTS
jgi:hypothetical protein